MNQIYLFVEQMNNFLNALRGTLVMTKAPDAAVMAEVQKILQPKITMTD
jgi:hypothetical protein